MTSDIVSHMIIGFVIYGFLHVVNLNQMCTLHSCQDMATERFWDYDVDLLGSRDVIGHVTIGLAVCGFLLVVNLN